MRYLLAAGSLSLFALFGLALVSVHDAAGQSTNNNFSPGQRNRAPGTAFMLGQPLPESAAEGDERARLNALDVQLGQQAGALVTQLADATDEKERAKAKESLQQTLAQQFDAQQKVRELEVAGIEARVERLRDVIAKRNEARGTIIEKRLDQLVRESEGLGWNSPAPSPYGSAFHPRDLSPSTDRPREGKTQPGNGYGAPRTQ